jgi:hypothetical protein
VIVNFDVDTLVTVPDDPPAAGPDRALDPPPSPPPPNLEPPPAPLPDALCPGVAEGEAAVAEADVAA